MLPPGSRLGHYEIVSELASGGMGHVLIARDPRLGRTVALKIIRDDFPDRREAVARFRNEARAASALNHPAIVHIYDIDEDVPILPDGREWPLGAVLYTAMEHVRGETLRKRLNRGDFDRTEFVGWMTQLADGVCKAHEAGILHRDLKPENVMITEDGFVKILDFGLAKLVGAGGVVADTPTAALLTRDGMAYGTAPYMSPEQLCGAPATALSDLFAIGCILFEGLTGRHPFDRSSIAEVIHAIVYEQPAPFVGIGSELTPQLVGVVKRCLEKDPARRYQTARELASALRSVGTATAPPQHVPSRRPLAWKFILPAVLLALVVAFAAMIAGRGGAFRSKAKVAADRIESIAVLPFANQGGDPEAEYLSDGITEAIIYDLSRSRSLRVVPRSSVFNLRGRSAREAAKTLGVDAVVLGEVSHHADQLVVHAELINGANGSLIWGGRLEKNASDLVAVRDEISAQIRESLQTQQPPARKDSTTDDEAFRLYLRGRYFWNKRTADGLRLAIEQFSRSIDRDPSYAHAWVGLGDSYALLEQYAGVPSRENCARAKAAVLRAKQIDPTLAPAYASLGLLYGHCDWNWTASEASFRKAIELDPNYATAHHWYALHLAYRHQFDRALQEAKRAQELDPLSLIAINATSVVQGYAGNWPLVERQSDRILEMDASFPVAHMWKGRALRAEGKLDAAIAEFSRGLELTGGRSLELIGELGSSYALAGRRREAGELAEKLKGETARNRSSAYPLATILASLGERDAALDALDHAFEDGGWFLVQLGVDPLLDPLRNEPRFRKMLERVSL